MLLDSGATRTNCLRKPAPVQRRARTKDRNVVNMALCRCSPTPTCQDHLHRLQQHHGALARKLSTSLEPCSIGLPRLGTIDYRLVDDIVDPRASQRIQHWRGLSLCKPLRLDTQQPFSEELVRIPGLGPRALGFHSRWHLATSVTRCKLHLRNGCIKHGCCTGFVPRIRITSAAEGSVNRRKINWKNDWHNLT